MLSSLMMSSRTWQWEGSEGSYCQHNWETWKEMERDSQQPDFDKAKQSQIWQTACIKLVSPIVTYLPYPSLKPNSSKGYLRLNNRWSTKSSVISLVQKNFGHYIVMLLGSCAIPMWLNFSLSKKALLRCVVESIQRLLLYGWIDLWHLFIKVQCWVSEISKLFRIVSKVSKE